MYDAPKESGRVVVEYGKVSVRPRRRCRQRLAVDGTTAADPNSESLGCFFKTCYFFPIYGGNGLRFFVYFQPVSAAGLNFSVV